jgi:O-antigen chain-terminating methyltransferase
MTPSDISLKQKIRSIPFVGFVFAWCNAFIRLPITRRHTDIQMQAAVERIQQSEYKLEQLTGETVKLLMMIQDITIRLDRNDKLDVGKRLMQFDQLQLGRQIKSVNLMMRTQQSKEDAIDLRFSHLERQLFAAADTSHQAAGHEPQSQPQPDTSVEVSSVRYDDFYLEFEALFRGQRADIKQRLAVYLTYLSAIAQQSQKDRPIVIDVGCGRGEWLELLDENGFPALGVDLNHAMVDTCLAAGLYARCADAIAVLLEQKPGSVGAVTGFHIIEHLPFEQLIALFDAAKQALCPGGIIIFETPNPENLKVGACNFYFDPTHHHPIVPQVAEFIAKQRGFSFAEILRLHPYPDDHRLHGDSAIEAVINKELFGPQDYAIIATK